MHEVLIIKESGKRNKIGENKRLDFRLDASLKPHKGWETKTTKNSRQKPTHNS